MILRRLAEGLRRQDPFTALIELAILVLGIYIGLQVDDWVGQRQDRASERLYLELLARDVDELQREAERQLAFERDVVATGARAHRLLDDEDPAAHREELVELLAALSTRRTLSLTSATFEQMLNSGHLQLIGDPELRDTLVRNFAQMRRDERIVEKNNQDLVDDIYGPFLLEIGITAINLGRLGPEQTLNRATEILHAELGPDFEPRPDRVLSRPADAETWSDLRRQVLFRMEVAAAGQAKAETIDGYLAELEDALRRHRQVVDAR